MSNDSNPMRSGFRGIPKDAVDFLRFRSSGSGILFGFALAVGCSLTVRFLTALFGNQQSSPLAFGMIFGIVFSHLFGIKSSFVPGIRFASRTLLRISVVLLGFKITLSELGEIGWSGYGRLFLIVISTFFFTRWIAEKIFGLKSPLAYLLAAGCSICGASAVLATSAIVRSETHENAIAVGIVTCFGLVLLFLEPALYQSGLLFGLNSNSFGFFAGTTIHEVAQAVTAGFTIGEESGKIATIVKLGRVLLLAPILFGLSLCAHRRSTMKTDASKTKITVPWFVFGFLLMVLIRSLIPISERTVTLIGSSNQFLMLVALTAIGLETNLSLLKKVGWRPFLAAGIGTLFLFSIGWVGALSAL
ncbi:YeiH family putative sulfate export transporter [Leptospira yasudae]|nr:YeiH family putative sulfate export transporter [Leptospira yasudae]TGM07732.1 YeiH family putative sulfate export transporter [Leptospira yasudae]